MSVVVGLDCKLYRNSATYNSPTWNEVTIAQDVSISVEKDEISCKSRASIFEAFGEGHIKAPIDLQLQGDKAADDFAIFQAAAIARGTVLDIAMADGAIATTGTTYLRADYHVFGWNRSEPLDGEVTVATKLNMAASSLGTHSPAYTTV